MSTKDQIRMTIVLNALLLRLKVGMVLAAMFLVVGGLKNIAKKPQLTPPQTSAVNAYDEAGSQSVGDPVVPTHDLDSPATDSVNASETEGLAAGKP